MEKKDVTNSQSEGLTAVKERTTLNLLELVCQLHSRALQYQSKDLHDAYVEARKELESRIASLPKEVDKAFEFMKFPGEKGSDVHPNSDSDHLEYMLRQAMGKGIIPIEIQKGFEGWLKLAEINMSPEEKQAASVIFIAGAKWASEGVANHGEEKRLQAENEGNKEIARVRGEAIAELQEENQKLLGILKAIDKWRWTTDGRKFDGNHKGVLEEIFSLFSISNESEAQSTFSEEGKGK